MAWLAGVGLLAGAGGAFLGGRAGDIKRQRLLNVADTPGVDTGALTGQALSDQLKYLPQGTELSGKISAANQAQLQAREEAALPGIGAARQQALGRITGLFADDSSWLKGVQQRGAALGLSSGLFGSAAGQLQTLRLSDQEQMQRTQLGTGLLGSLIGGMRIANTPGVQAFLGPTPDQLINIRSQERQQRMNLQAQAAGVPGQMEAWGNYLTGIGGAMTGAGLTGAGTGGIFGGNQYSGMGNNGFTTSDYFQNQRMFNESRNTAFDYNGDINTGGFGAGMA